MTTSPPDPARDAIIARSRPTTSQARTDREVARLLDDHDSAEAETWFATECAEKRLLACVASLLPVRETTLLGGSAFPHGRPRGERLQFALRVLVLHRLLSDPDFVHNGDPYNGREQARVQDNRRWQRGLLRTGDGSYEQRWYELVREAADEFATVEAKPKGKLTHLELAERYGVDSEVARKRLYRWRKRNLDGWAEVTERRRGEPQYVYELAAVAHLFVRE